MEKNTSLLKETFTDKKILLAILPYWDPMIPPTGIASLKSFLQPHGYKVRTVDFIVKRESLDFYNNYFELLKQGIPEEKRGNFLNIGHDVLQNHMMAHINNPEEKKYIQLVKILIYKSYYVQVRDSLIQQLNQVMETFYRMLEKYFLELIEEEKPGIVGVTAYKCTIPASLFVLKLVKEAYPFIKTVMGGGTFNESHAPGSPNFDALLKATEGYLDKIFIGQGELLFLEYLEGKLTEEKRVYTKEDVGGRVLDFESQDIPDFTDLNLHQYPCLVATASASCKYQCSFCVARKVAGKYRVKDPAQTVKEMVELYGKYGHQLFFMTDSLLNPVATDLAREMIRTAQSLYYDSYFRVDDLSADVRNTMLWRKGGLYRVRLGTESGSQRILNIMEKKITPDQIRAAISGLAYAGIKTTTYWVIGHPGETEEDFQMTLDLIEELKNDIFQAECNPFLYHFSQQHQADEWAPHRIPLYPEEMKDLLVFQSYTLNIEPLRQEAYQRMFRFTAHCQRLGIPNPYSFAEHSAADERWKELHKHAVPPILDFIKRKKNINENLNMEEISLARDNRNEEGDFCF